LSALRVAVVGAGARVFSGFHVGALETIGAEVVGVEDLVVERAERVGAEHGWPVYRDLDSILAVPADLVVVTAWHTAHAEIALAALAAGRNVLVEKPMAIRTGDGRRMIDEADRRGLLLATVLQHHFRPEVVEARRLIDSGFLGTLHRATVTVAYPKRSFYYIDSPWRGSWAGEGGGVLINQGQHYIDLLCHLAGRPSRVIGRTKTLVQPMEAEDTAEALLEWPGGATGSLHLTTAALDDPPRVELVGSHGRIRITPGILETTRYAEDFADYAASPGQLLDRLGSDETIRRELGTVTISDVGVTHPDVYRDVAAALAEGRVPRTSGREGIAPLEVTNAITLSSFTGAPVDLPLDAAAYDALLDRLSGKSR
jgi:predicted dehydrogenase